MKRNKSRPVRGQSQLGPEQLTLQTQQAAVVEDSRARESAALAAQTAQFQQNYNVQLGLIQQQTAELQAQRLAQLQRDEELQRAQQAQTALLQQNAAAIEQSTGNQVGRTLRNPSRSQNLAGRQVSARQNRANQVRRPITPPTNPRNGLFNTY